MYEHNTIQYNTIQYKTYNAPYVTKMLFVDTFGYRLSTVHATEGDRSVSLLNRSPKARQAIAYSLATFSMQFIMPECEYVNFQPL